MFFLAGANCPAGTPRAGQAGLSWFYYAQTPGEVKGAETEISYFPIDDLSISVSRGLQPVQGRRDEHGAAHVSRLELAAAAEVDDERRRAIHGPPRRLRSIDPAPGLLLPGYRTNGTINLPQRDPDDLIPGYGIYNARITFEPANSEYQVSLAVLNLPDHFYWSQLSTATTRLGAPATARSGNPGRPREWSIEFRKNFRGCSRTDGAAPGEGPAPRLLREAADGGIPVLALAKFSTGSALAVHPRRAWRVPGRHPSSRRWIRKICSTQLLRSTKSSQRTLAARLRAQADGASWRLPPGSRGSSSASLECSRRAHLLWAAESDPPRTPAIERPIHVPPAPVRAQLQAIPAQIDMTPPDIAVADVDESGASTRPATRQAQSVRTSLQPRDELAAALLERRKQMSQRDRRRGRRCGGCDQFRSESTQRARGLPSSELRRRSRGVLGGT